MRLIYIYFFSLLFVSCNLSAQTLTRSQIDSIIAKVNAVDAYKKYGVGEILRLTTETYHQSKEISYKEGENLSMIKFLEIYFNTGNVDEMINRLPAALELSNQVEDFYVLARVHRYEAWAMTKIGQYDKAKYSLREAENFAKKVKNDDNRYSVLMNINSSFASYYEAKTADVDSMMLYAKQAYKYAGIIKNPLKKCKSISSTANVVAGIYLYKNDDINAEKYLNIAVENLKILDDKLAVPKIYKTLGGLASKRKDYGSAIRYFTEALSIAKENGQSDEVMNILPMLSNAQQLSQKFKDAALTMNEYKKIDDSIKSDVKHLNNKISRGVEVKTIRKKNIDSKYVLIICAMSLLLLASLLWFKKKRTHKLPKTEVKETIRDSDESKTLDFEVIKNLAEIAKKDEQAFYTSFLSVFKNFNDGLLKDFPELSKADLRLAAYLKMNFDTKQIASLTNSSIKSIDAKKYRLRKKIQLSSNDNLYQFIAKY